MRAIIPVAGIGSRLKPHTQTQPKSLIPLQGPAIKGEQHIREVIEQHIDFFQKCLDDEGQVPRSVPRPAQTALWYSPHPPWPLKENESL
mgnify:CR=1 FL=1